MDLYRDEAVDRPVSVATDAALESLAPRFAALTRLLLAATTVAEVLHRVVTAAHELVPGADLVSVTLRGPDGVYYTPIRTEPLAEQLDQIQYETGEGPCVESARIPGPASALCGDLGLSAQWPAFGPAAAARGMHSVLAVALLPDARPPQLTGALNLYSRRMAGLTDADRDIALLLATHASLALATTQAVTTAELHSVQLHRAIESRDIIGQAKGILMNRRGINAEEAFDLLRTTSQGMNVKLADLARILATRHLELDLPPSNPKDAQPA
jgi:hypothetical protein